MDPVSLQRAFAATTEHWSPRRVASVNDYDVRIATVHGEFVPHRHPDTDEFFLVLEGELLIRTEQGEVRLGPGELVVVPRGVQHQPVAPRETRILLFEPRTVVNTGDAGGERTAEVLDADG